MRARKDDLLARRALNLSKRAMQPGIHHVKRAKKERLAAANERRDARPAERRGKAIIDSDSSSQSGDDILIAKRISELGETLPNPAQEPEEPAEGRQSIDDYPIPGLGSIKIDRTRKTLNAHCRCLGRLDDPRDHTTRATPRCTLTRAANKAPLGFLLEWLRCQGDCCDREAQLHARWLIQLDARKRVVSS